MEAIRPGSVAKYNLLEESESTDVGASGGKISDIGMGLRAESDEIKHQSEETEVARTIPDRDNNALNNHTDNTASLCSATTTDDPYEDMGELYYDDITNEKRYPISKAIAAYETSADELEDKKVVSPDPVSAQLINKDPRNDKNLATDLPPHPPRTLSFPVLPQGPQPQKPNMALSVLGTDPSDIKASNSVDEYEYIGVPSTSTRTHPIPPLTSQPSQVSHIRSTHDHAAPGFRKRSYQLQYSQSPTTKLVSPLSEPQLSNSPSSRPPLPPPNQEMVKVSSSQLQQIVQNMVQETVGKLLKKDTTSEQDCEESEAANDQTQQLTLEHLSQPMSSRKRNVYEGDRGFPATKKVEETCLPMGNNTTKPVPPVPKLKSRNLSRNKLETQVESAQSEFDNTILCSVKNMN